MTSVDTFYCLLRRVGHYSFLRSKTVFLAFTTHWVLERRLYCVTSLWRRFFIKGNFPFFAIFRPSQKGKMINWMYSSSSHFLKNQFVSEFLCSICIYILYLPSRMYIYFFNKHRHFSIYTRDIFLTDPLLKIILVSFNFLIQYGRTRTSPFDVHFTHDNCHFTSVVPLSLWFRCPSSLSMSRNV